MVTSIIIKLLYCNLFEVIYLYRIASWITYCSSCLRQNLLAPHAIIAIAIKTDSQSFCSVYQSDLFNLLICHIVKHRKIFQTLPGNFGFIYVTTFLQVFIQQLAFTPDAPYSPTTHWNLPTLPWSLFKNINKQYGLHSDP